MKRICHFLIWILFLTAAAVAGREEISAPAGLGAVFTWEDLLRAVEKHPFIGMGNGLTAQSEGFLSSSREIPNPEASFMAGKSRAVIGEGEDDIYSAELLFPVDWIWTRGPKIDAAKAGLDAANEEKTALRNDAAYELKSIFLRIAADQKMLENLRSFDEEYAGLVEMTRKRVDAGEDRPSNLGRIQTEYEKFRIELARIEDRMQAGRRILNQWIGNTLPEDYSISFELEEMPELFSLEEVLAKAGDKNPGIIGGRARLRQAEAEVNIEKSRAIPAVSLGGSYEREMDVTNIGLTISVTLPVFNLNGGAVAAARGAKITAVSKLDETVKRIKQEAAEVYASAAGARKAALSYKDIIIPRTEENVQATGMMYRYGQVSLLDVIDTRRVLLEAKLDYISLLTEYHTARARLISLMGEQ